MPVWLQIVGAIASAMLSYYGRYDDSRVREMIRDVAKNINLALQRLNEISLQVAQLTSLVERLPDEFREISYEAELRRLNDTILASILRLKQLLATTPSTPLFREQVKDIYNNTVTARTELQVKSVAGPVKFTPLAALVSPISQLLELSLLYHLGREGRELSRATRDAYRDWFNFLLDPAVPNSVAANVSMNAAALSASDATIAAGLFAPALGSPGSAQALYCLEHQIGNFPHPLFPDGRTFAQVLNETWIRFYGVTTAVQKMDSGEQIWDIEALGASFRVEQYAKAAGTGAWYGATPPWSIPVDSYDSRDVGGYQGQSHAERVADIMNSPKWRAFVTTTLPASTRDLDQNNRTRIELRVARDVLAAVGAAKAVAERIEAGFIEAEAPPA
ncbi:MULTISPECIES: hypothetical protein [unclassified Bradyrhizobium]|uniref:hypothetical protein n=1 Tax=unclassified Bradyrhizobium TaxID=2631580 RepID=UPI001CD7D7B5|nr:MULTISPECIES: hypothetical protein [unclassified Bradyrhizobium]MCA1374327.1 hypothetical protein [Bradyrhizobium sp. IC4060]MCA1484701.1 hypothetical protein [Bradyrhizobium sp. IC4061]